MRKESEKEYIRIEPKEIMGFPEKEALGEEAQIVVDKQEGKIVKIGNPREIEAWIEGVQSKTALGTHPAYNVEALELQEGKMLPGLIETHSHPTLYSMLEVVKPVYLSGVRSKEELRKQLKQRVGKEKGSVLALGWSTVEIPDLSKDDLDEVGGAEALIVLDPSFHGAVANSKGLEELDYLRKLREEELGRKLKGSISSAGKITEEFVFLGLELVESQKSIEELTEAKVAWIQKELEHGITTIHDMAVITPREINTVLSSREKWKEKYPGVEFPVSRFFVRPEVLKTISSRAEKMSEIGEKLKEIIEKRMVGIKLLADGSIGSYTAHLAKPYLDKKTRGIEFDTIRDAKEAYRLAKQWGISEIATHALGEKAIKSAIEFAQEWFREKEPDKIFRIEHFEISGEEEIIREAAHSGIWLSSQPTFITDIVTYEKRLGRERTKIMCPHRSIVKAGVPMMFGTDGMPQNMLFALWCATHHPNKEERLSLEEAIIASAAMAGEYEKSQKGRLAEGAPADFVVIDPSTLSSLCEEGLSEKEIRELIGSPSKVEELAQELDEGVKAVIKSGKVIKALKQK